jgi:hypothetical protein
MDLNFFKFQQMTTKDVLLQYTYLELAQKWRLRLRFWVDYIIIQLRVIELNLIYYL